MVSKQIFQPSVWSCHLRYLGSRSLPKFLIYSFKASDLKNDNHITRYCPHVIQNAYTRRCVCNRALTHMNSKGLAVCASAAACLERFSRGTTYDYWVATGQRRKHRPMGTSAMIQRPGRYEYIPPVTNSRGLQRTKASPSSPVVLYPTLVYALCSFPWGGHARNTPAYEPGLRGNATVTEGCALRAPPPGQKGHAKSVLHYIHNLLSRPRVWDIANSAPAKINVFVALYLPDACIIRLCS